ncbi:hypothetical protein WR25_00021 [Diploscapter pachys]|uniref:Organic solute transporter alpha-like protein n=1 Tax=Diploscapter pachys TaxID=2018661 RepID=A0A2A2KDW8_9BILA|nr:hypothetical protein WR25_00021 [Diploscapter pachys]
MIFFVLRDIHYYVPNEYVKSDLYFIAMIPVFVGFCCVGGNILVRSSSILYAVGLTYLMICLHMAIILIIRLFGTRKGLANWLVEQQKDIVFDTKPYCCCCKCLPTTKVTVKRVRILSYCVRQSPIIRILLQLALIIMNVEGVTDQYSVTQVLNGIGVASALLAVYCSHILVTLTREKLEPYNMYTIFRCVNVTQMLFSLQKFFLDLIAKNGGMGGLSMAPPSVVSRFWFNVTMTFELAIVAYVMLKEMRPGKCGFFVDRPNPDARSNRIVPMTDII